MLCPFDVSKENSLHVARERGRNVDKIRVLGKCYPEKQKRTIGVTANIGSGMSGFVTEGAGINIPLLDDGCFSGSVEAFDM